MRGFLLCLLFACNGDPIDGPPADLSAGGCPDHLAAGACSPEGLACYYNLTETYCVEGQWLQCGDAIGTACPEQAAIKEGSICCPNDFAGMRFGNICDCVEGRQCRCDSYHVHCAACDM